MRASRIERLLPEVFQRCVRAGTPLSALLSAMESLHAPAEHTLSDVDSYFSAYRSPERFLSVLARWLDLDEITEPKHFNLQPDEWAPTPSLVEPGNLRELIASAAHFSQWRGTAYGLKRFLETAVGHPGFDIEEQVTGHDGLPRPYHVKVLAPKAAERQRALIERIVELEKPAYVTFELAFKAPQHPDHRCDGKRQSPDARLTRNVCTQSSHSKVQQQKSRAQKAEEDKP